MAIINCPACNERISDKAKTCSHCGYNLVSGVSAEGLTEEQLESKAKLTHMKRRYSLQMQAMSGIIIFLLGVMLWYFVGDRGLNTMGNYLQLGIAAAGGIWYLVTRVRLISFKKSR